MVAASSIDVLSYYFFNFLWSFEKIKANIFVVLTELVVFVSWL